VLGRRSPSTLESTTSANDFLLPLDFDLGFTPADDSFADVDLVLVLGVVGSAAGLGDSDAIGLEAFNDVALDLCFRGVDAVCVSAWALPDLDFALMTTRVWALESGSGDEGCET
jgi:hypothetical protein